MESKAGLFSWLNYKTLKKNMVGRSVKKQTKILLESFGKLLNFTGAWMSHEVSKWLG